MRFGKLRLKNDRLFLFSKSLVVDVGPCKNPGISHQDRTVSYRIWFEEVELTVNAGDYFMKNLTKSATFNTASFYRAENTELGMLRKEYVQLPAFA